MTELDPRDRELAQALRQTLDAAASRPDPLLDAALAATRARVADRHKRHTSWWVAGGFAVAACLAVVVVMPFGAQPAGRVSPPVAVEAAPMPDADLQLLEDMDMLAAMNEGRHEG